MFFAYSLCSLYCCLHNFDLILHVYHILNKLKILVKLVIQNLELNNANTHRVHQMIQYANNLILILFNTDET